MKRYQAHQHVEPGIYFCMRHLAFRSMDEEGRLPGKTGDVYRRVPALAMLVVGPVLGLVFAVFLPVVGIVMTARLAIEKLRARFPRGPEPERSASAEVPIHVERHTRIHVPLERAYAMARDPEHWSDWYVGPDESAREPSRIGDQDAIWMRFPLRQGVVDEQFGAGHGHWRSETHGPAMTLTLGHEGKALVVPGIQDWTWEEVDGETEVTVEVDCAVPLEGDFAKAPPETLRSLEAASLERSLDGLKHYCEAVH